MKKSFATAGVLVLAAFALASPMRVSAQESDETETQRKTRRTTTISGGAAAASAKAREKHQAESTAAAQGPVQFPLATRQAPKASASPRASKELNEIIGLLDKKQTAEAITRATALAAGSSNAYEQSFAYQLAANAAADAGNHAQAADYFGKALAANGLDNNGHYMVMYNLAVMQYTNNDNAAALATLDRFLGETKADKPDYVSLKAALLSRLGRAPEAAALYEAQLAKTPDDKKLLMNAVALYQEANNQAKANALLASAQQRGLLTEPSEYRVLYVGMIADAKYKDAIAVIDDGLARKIIVPSPTLANDYQVIAQNLHAQGDTATAIEIYRRASTMASDGEALMNLARLLINEGRMKEARALIPQAIAKGVKNPANAQRLLESLGK